MVTAEELAKSQREISIAEFFEKNRHLLGFDNARKALLTTVKEAVDNSLDACEEAEILPELEVEVVDMGKDRYRIIIEDNGPGIVKEQIPKIFAKLLYGSKFHKLSQSLTADQPVFVKQNNKLQVTTMGELIDAHIQEEGVHPITHIEVPAFNPQTHTYEFRKASHLIKHKRKNDVYTIKTAYGKTISVTGCHSVFTYNAVHKKPEIKRADELRVGDHILAPTHIPDIQTTTHINLVDEIPSTLTKERWWYVYGLPKQTIKKLAEQATIIHKKKAGDKSRKYYVIAGEEILDDSFKQYQNKQFIPIHLAKELRKKNLLSEQELENCTIRSYRHGKTTEIPAIWSLTPQLMRFLGLYVAEGHAGKRQAALTLHRKETHLIAEAAQFAQLHGLNYTVEQRPRNATRIKLFGGCVPELLKSWCGIKSHNKKTPWFIFSAGKELRQNYLDGLYIGDGHDTPKRNQLMHSTVSKQLAQELTYLWLMQGVTASQYKKQGGTIGKTSRKAYVTVVTGEDINESYEFSTNTNTQNKTATLSEEYYLKNQGLGHTKQAIQQYKTFLENPPKTITQTATLWNSDKPGYKLRVLKEKGIITKKNNEIILTQLGQEVQATLQAIQEFQKSDFLPVKITHIQKNNKKNEYVYDISVPEAENFLAGTGGITAHNSRGQQGIGISASVMYGQLTTGRAAKIISKTGADKPAHYLEVKINTQKNTPEIVREEEKEWSKEHGTRIEIDLEGSYAKGNQSVDAYLKQTAIVNPHLQLIYVNPKGEQYVFPRASNQVPKAPKEIKPHPYGIELGMLIKLLTFTEEKTILAFLREEFSRVSNTVANDICSAAKISPKAKPKTLSRQQAEDLLRGMRETKIMSPPTDCISPIGQQLLLKGMKKEINAEFYTAVSRTPAVYRGNPFVIECCIAYGGTIKADGAMEILRFANKVPLLYQQGGCAVTKAIQDTNWKSYGLEQSGNSTPRGPVMILVHMASVWVPFTSEAKEALAHYDDIIKEIKLCVQEAGRELQKYTKKKQNVKKELKKRGYIEKYLPHLANGVNEILEGDEADREFLESGLQLLLEKKRGALDTLEFDPSKNEEYDEEFAKIGVEEDE